MINASIEKNPSRIILLFIPFDHLIDFFLDQIIKGYFGRLFSPRIRIRDTVHEIPPFLSSLLINFSLLSTQFRVKLFLNLGEKKDSTMRILFCFYKKLVTHK